MLEYIREYWSQGQLISVGGDYNAQAIPLLKESLPDRWAYSIVLDDSVRHNPNLKAALWRDLLESGVIQALMKFGLGQIIISLLKFSPYPSQLVTQIQQAAAQAAANPQPQPPGRAQRGQGAQGAPGRATRPPEPPQKIAAEVQLKTAQAQKAMAQAREIDMRTGVSVPKLALEAMAQGHQRNLDIQQQQHEQNVHGHQRQMDLSEAQHRRGMDMTNAMLKGVGAVSGLMGRGMQPRGGPQGMPSPEGAPPQGGPPMPNGGGMPPGGEQP